MDFHNPTYYQTSADFNAEQYDRDLEAGLFDEDPDTIYNENNEPVMGIGFDALNWLRYSAATIDGKQYTEDDYLQARLDDDAAERRADDDKRNS